MYNETNKCKQCHFYKRETDSCPEKDIKECSKQEIKECDNFLVKDKLVHF